MISSPERADEELMAAYCAGDNQAFAELYARYWDFLWSLARRWGFSEWDAEDIAEEILLKVVSKKALYEWKEASLKTWVCTIARNYMISEFRKRGSRLPEVLLDCIEDDPRVSSEEGDEQRDVRECLESLPGVLRDTLELIFFKGYKQSRMAELKGVADATISNRKRDALKVMRTCLEARGYRVIGDGNRGSA